MFAKTREGMAASEQVPVLAVGGSLVGLTTSVLLASHGVRASRFRAGRLTQVVGVPHS